LDDALVRVDTQDLGALGFKFKGQRAAEAPEPDNGDRVRLSEAFGGAGE
jgi:hypothetical protein